MKISHLNQTKLNGLLLLTIHGVLEKGLHSNGHRPTISHGHIAYMLREHNLFCWTNMRCIALITFQQAGGHGHIFQVRPLRCALHPCETDQVQP